MGGCSFFDVHYGITGINLETSNIDELGKSTDKNQVCLLNARFIIQCTVYRGGGGEGRVAMPLISRLMPVPQNGR